MDSRRDNRKKRFKLEIQLKICVLIILGALVVNRYNAPLGEKISEKLRLDEDYQVEEIAAAVYTAVEDAQMAMSNALETFSSKSAVSEG